MKRDTYTLTDAQVARAEARAAERLAPLVSGGTEQTQDGRCQDHNHVWMQGCQTCTENAATAPLAAAIQRVRELHAQYEFQTHRGAIVPACVECEETWPCTTIAALDGSHE